jgi:hypothetical protein
VASLAATERVRGTAPRAVIADVGWRVVVGTAAGAVAGLLVGGVGGRLAMLLLRLTSPKSVIGLTSDDGFEIGVVSTSTFALLVVTTGLGAAAGALYAGLRGAMPVRLRLPLWTAFGAVAGGAALVHDDGVDFTALEPGWLAVALFVAIPAAVAAVIVILTERWTGRPAWRSRRLTAFLVVAAAASTLALVVPLAIAAAMVIVLALLDLMGPGAAERARLVAATVVPIALAAVAILAAVDLVSESARILD